jgi:hypothetical protein
MIRKVSLALAAASLLGFAPLAPAHASTAGVCDAVSTVDSVSTGTSADDAISQVSDAASSTVVINCSV